MTPSIFYYISGHGFGHATRAAEVIRFLKRRRPDVPIHVRSSADHNIINEMCSPDSCHSRSYDVGVVQTDGITMNIPATLKAGRELSESYPEIVRDEIREAQKHNVKMIISDIPSIAMRIADKLGVPGIIIANFTWDWIYDAWQKEYPEITEITAEIHADYLKCHTLYRLPFSPAFNSFPRVQDIPLIGRPAKTSRDDVRDRLNIPSDRPVILLSFGGMGLKTGNLARLSQLKDYHFITLGSYDVPGQVVDPAHLKQNNLFYPDLVGAVDVVVSKPGYGIVAECAVNGIRMLYTDRGSFREYEIIESEMKDWVHCQHIDRDHFESGQWEQYLEPLISNNCRIRPAACDGAILLADRISRFFKEVSV